MLKLIRAIKFMNKLNKLKQQDGFEVFGSAISLGGAIFLLLFVSHLLGCVFTCLAQYETEYNWLSHYRHAADRLQSRKRSRIKSFGPLVWMVKEGCRMREEQGYTSERDRNSFSDTGKPGRPAAFLGSV